MTHMIEATGVVKRFGATTALDGLELFAEQGVILAVLGPNGAGKTTFVRCIATLIKPDGAPCACSATTSSASPTPCSRRSGWPASSPPSSRP
jgi:ABC-type multidrug transport system ATPase subunit